MPSHTFDEQFKRRREALRAKAASAPKFEAPPAPGAGPRQPFVPPVTPPPPKPRIVTTSPGAGPGVGAPDLTTSQGATSFQREVPITPGKVGGQSKFQQAKERLKSAFTRSSAGAPPPPAGSVPATPDAAGKPSLRARAQKGIIPKALAAATAGKALAAQTDPDALDRYQKRFGITLKGDESFGDYAKLAALTAGGFASDLGANVVDTASSLFGGPENLVRQFYRDEQAPVEAGAEPVVPAAAQPTVPAAPAAVEQTVPETTRESPIRNRITQTGPSSFTNVPGQEQDLGKPGGGLSVIGGGAEQLASEERAAKQFALNERVRQARKDDPTVTEEDLLASDARRAQSRARDSEIFELTQAGLSRDEAARRIFARDAKLAEAQLDADAKGGASLSDQIALASLAQRTSASEEGLRIRGEQLGVSKEQLEGEQETEGRKAIQSTIKQINDPDPNVANAALTQVFEAGAADPASPEGQLAFAQIERIIREKAGEERGVLDESAALLPEFLGGGPQPDFTAIASGNFTLEEGFAGKGLTGTKIKDANGVDIGNLQDYPPAAQEFIKKVFAAKQQTQGIRR